MIHEQNIAKIGCIHTGDLQIFLIYLITQNYCYQPPNDSMDGACKTSK